MKKIFCLLIGLIIFACPLNFLLADESASEILNKMDYNSAPDTIIYNAKLVIHQSNRTDVKEFKLYGSGQERSFVVFMSPLRDKNISVLRINDNLWMYYPSAEKTIKLSGHMLRQSFMGSDFSYEDGTERWKMLEKYDGTITGSDQINGRPTYVLSLTAKKSDATYYKKIIWIDKEKYVMLKGEMYAKSGKLLKTAMSEVVQQFDNRYYATTIRMEDKLRKDKFSEMIFSNIQFDPSIPESTFTLKNLEQRQ